MSTQPATAPRQPRSSTQRRADFEQLALPHLDAAWGYACRLTRNGSDADDLVQASLLRAYRFFDNFAPGTSFKAWLFRIIRNTFINEYRRRRARPESTGHESLDGADEGLEMSSAEPTAGPARALEARLLRRDIEHAMRRLPDVYREVVWLCLVAELTYQEAAATLGVPLGTVMSRLHRGRRLLRESLLARAAEDGIGVSRAG